MKTLFAAFFISVAAALCLAQSDAQKEPNWQSFAPDKEEFTTEVPTVLIPQIGVRGLTRSYRGKLNGTWFFIFSDAVSSQSSTKIALDFARATQPVGTPETFGNMPSEKFEFADDEGFYHCLFTFKTKTRIYVLQTVSSEKDDPLAERFFAKLQIGRIQPLDAMQTSSESENNETLSPDKRWGFAGDKRSEMLPDAPQKTPNLRAQTSPLQLESKPIPLYTDLARFYDVTGTVRLRITFSSDGTIGSVVPLIKLPFGLTKKAVDAAKKIRFQSPIRDGQPYTVTKLVEYSFNIY
jgi:hypothetical protein